MNRKIWIITFLAFASLCCNFVPQTEFFTIYGKVRQPNGDPIPNAIVELSEIGLLGKENVVANAVTNQYGSYRFDLLERKSYGMTFTLKTLVTGFKPIVMSPSLNEYNFDMTIASGLIK